MKFILLGIVVVIFLNSCGSGGSDSYFKNATKKINIDVNCTTTEPTALDIYYYITVESDDVIVTEEEGSVISTYHDINGVKKICLVNGSAYILRK